MSQTKPTISIEQGVLARWQKEKFALQIFYLVTLSIPHYGTCPNTGPLYGTVMSTCQSVLIIYLHCRDLRTRRSGKAFALIMVSYQPHLSPYNLTCTSSSRKAFACCVATDKNTSLLTLPRLTTILLVLHASTQEPILSISRD